MMSRIPIPFLVLLAFFPLFFGGTGTESFAETTLDFQKAQGYFEKGDYQQAEQIYQEIIKQCSDANHALEAQKGLVMVYISLDKQAETESAYQQLLSNFPHNTHMADVIHHGIASHYRKCKKNDKADELDKYVLGNWPTSDSAMWAQVEIVGASINRKDLAAAQMGVDGLFAGFANNEHLCAAIHSVAYRYRQAQETTRADELDKYVLNNWPASESAMWAQVDIINSNIDGKDYATAQTYISSLLTGFVKNEHLCDAIHNVAYRYRQAQETGRADELDKYVLNNWPASESAMWAQVDITNSNIDSKDYAAAQTGIDNLLSHFSDNENMANVLHGMAYKYRHVQETARADELDQYVLSHWPATVIAIWAQADIINSNIVSKNYITAQTGIDDLLARFSGNENMASVLHGIAYKYRQVQETAKANEISQYILNHWPLSEIALWVQADIINSSIDSKDYTAAQAGIEGLLTRFSGNENIASMLHGIAYKYRQARETAKADELDKYVLSHWPNSESAMWSQIDIIKFGIGDMNASDVWVDVNNLAAVFSDVEELPYAIFQIADSWYRTGKYEDANQLGRKLVGGWPDDKYTLWTQLAAALANIQMNDANMAEAATDNLGMDFAENVKFPDAMLIIAEAYYEKGNRYRDKVFFETSLNMLNDVNTEGVSSNLKKADICYAKGLAHWQLGKYFDSANAFSASIEANPEHEFAGNMHWLVSDCYEKLKAVGDVNAVEADPIIEWGYQTLFDNYPNCNIIDYAAMRLSQINLDKGNEIAACGYYCWLVMKNDDPNGIGFVDAMFKKCEKCGGCGK